MNVKLQQTLADDDEPDSKVSQEDGTIYLERARITVRYDPEQWHKDDSFIAVGVQSEDAQNLVCNCTQQHAEIGATFFNYTVVAPAERTQPIDKNWKYPVMFRRAKDGDPG